MSNTEKPGVKGYGFLRRLREKAGLSQTDLALDCGVTRGAVIRWESGRCEPERTHRRPLAKAIGITVGELGRRIYEAQG